MQQTGDKQGDAGAIPLPGKTSATYSGGVKNRNLVLHGARVARPRAAAATLRASGRTTLASAAATLAAVLAMGMTPTVRAQAPETDVAMAGQVSAVTRWAQERAVDASASLPPGARVEIVPGQLDPRLRLAPCSQIEPYLPAGSRAWGRTRVGLRCLAGASRWNVYLPITVRVLAPAPVLREPLPAGTEINASHLTEAEVDWADRPGAPVADPFSLVGRILARPMLAGSAVRDADLQRRQWFAAGERVKITAVGRGYAVSTEGQALTRGVDGETVRVRTEGGRVVSGTAVGDRQVEIAL